MSNNRKSGIVSSLVVLFVLALVVKLILPALKFLFFILLIGAAALVVAIIVSGIKSGSDEKPTQNNADILKAGSSSQTIKKVQYTDEQAKALSIADGTLTQCTITNNTIQDGKVRESANEAIAAARKILDALKDQPDEIPRLHQLMNYYMPTLNAVISKYKTLEKNGVSTEKSKEQILPYLSDIKKALAVQYEKLFANEVLDMSVEMEAMQMAFKRDGLLTEAEIPEQAVKEFTTLTI